MASFDGLLGVEPGHEAKVAPGHTGLKLEADPVYGQSVADAQIENKRPEPESLDTKRNAWKDPSRTILALVEIKDVLSRGVDRVRTAE